MVSKIDMRNTDIGSPEYKTRWPFMDRLSVKCMDGTTDYKTMKGVQYICECFQATQSPQSQVKNR